MAARNEPRPHVYLEHYLQHLDLPHLLSFICIWVFKDCLLVCDGTHSNSCVLKGALSFQKLALLPESQHLQKHKFVVCTVCPLKVSQQ